MTKWRVEVLPVARRELAQLRDAATAGVLREALETLTELADDPFPFDSILLEGYTDLYRVPFYRGRYRIVYQVSTKRRSVVITRVRPRAIAYQGLEPR